MGTVRCATVRRLCSRFPSAGRGELHCLLSIQTALRQQRRRIILALLYRPLCISFSWVGGLVKFSQCLLYYLPSLDDAIKTSDRAQSSQPSLVVGPDSNSLPAGDHPLARLDDSLMLFSFILDAGGWLPETKTPRLSLPAFHCKLHRREERDAERYSDELRTNNSMSAGWLYCDVPISNGLSTSIIFDRVANSSFSSIVSCLHRIPFPQHRVSCAVSDTLRRALISSASNQNGIGRGQKIDSLSASQKNKHNTREGAILRRHHCIFPVGISWRQTLLRSRSLRLANWFLFLVFPNASSSLFALGAPSLSHQHSSVHGGKKSSGPSTLCTRYFLDEDNVCDAETLTSPLTYKKKSNQKSKKGGNTTCAE